MRLVRYQLLCFRLDHVFQEFLGQFFILASCCDHKVVDPARGVFFGNGLTYGKSGFFQIGCVQRPTHCDHNFVALEQVCELTAGRPHLSDLRFQFQQLLLYCVELLIAEIVELRGVGFVVAEDLGGHEGLPFIQLSGGFTIGNNGEGELPQVGNSFQWSDSLSKVVGKHSLKFGGDVRRQRFDQTLYFDVSGEYFVDGTSSNSTLGDTVFSDYLLGFPGSYGQGSAQVENVRSTGLYLFGQDSWKIKPNITLNYGLRWELNTPIADISHHVQTFRPGQSTKIYPCQLSQASIDALGSSDCSPYFPTGLLVPGDTGVPNGMAQPYWWDEQWTISVQHTEADIDKHIAAFDDIAASLAKAQQERAERVPAEVAH